MGIGGVLAGTFVRKLMTPEPRVLDALPRHLLTRGSPFPDVGVIDEHGRPHRTRELLTGGGVALILDLECSPCEDISLKWQEVLDADTIEGLRVVGITMHGETAIEEFRERSGVRFPIVADTAQVFLGEHRVTRFPLEVIVDARGNMRAFDHDADAPLDVVEIAGLLGG